VSGPCNPPRFTRLSSTEFGQTLGQQLIPVADDLRDLQTQFGLRPYRVRIIRTRWTGGRRGIGEEVVSSEMEILPVPLVSDLTSLAEIVSPVGLDEHGGIVLSEVSGRYTDDQLRGLDIDGTPPAEDEQVMYEVEFPRSDGKPGERRRFHIRSAPHYFADEFQWRVPLERAHEGRDRRGELR
jgi:hypothetical protein